MDGLGKVNLYSDALVVGPPMVAVCVARPVGGRNITLKEILQVVLACAIWGPQWFGARVVAHVDNEAAVVVLNSGNSREGQIMQLIRSIFFILAYHQISLSACHTPGTQNGAADAILRDNLQLFFSLLQVADSWPAPIPLVLAALLQQFCGH